MSESCNAFKIITVWNDVKVDSKGLVISTTPYKIDEFSSLLFQEANRPVDCMITVEEYTGEGITTDYF